MPRLEKRRRRRMVYVNVGMNLSEEDKKLIHDIHPSAEGSENHCVINRIITSN